MPKHKDLKRLTRSRMAKTGESYTAARTQLLAKKARAAEERLPAAPSPPPPDYAARAGMTDESIHAKTGRTWEQWVHALDEQGAASWPHRDIAFFVAEHFEVSHWWAQTVTVGYERIKGLREIGQRRSGTYETSKSKTVPVPLATLYRAFADPRTRQRWLPGAKPTVRKATPEKYMHITWEDGTSVEVGFVAKGEAKSQVSIAHIKLPSRTEAEVKKAYWAERLGALAELLAATGAADR